MHPALDFDNSPMVSERDGEVPAESVLFGFDDTERIVAIEPGEREVVIWQRIDDGSLLSFREPFVPWLLTATPESSIASEPRELKGEGFRYLYEFPGWSAFQSA